MKQYKHLLLTMDLEESSNFVVEGTVSLASAWDAKLSVIYVMDSIPPYACGFVGMADLEDQFEAESKLEIKEVLKKLDYPNAKVIVKTGITAQLITEVAEEVGADLIVVGSHDKHGFANLFKSTAEGVLSDAQCDVLVMKAPTS